MNILFCRWESMCEPGIINALKNTSNNLIIYNEKFEHVDYDTSYLKKLSDYIYTIEKPDCLFSVNYIPIISRLCNILKITYISWVVDCPCHTLYSNTIVNECNQIFLFDKLQVEKFHPLNPGHIHHLPLGCDISLLDLPLSQKYHSQFDCDVSFIGSLYTERCEYDNFSDKLPDYVHGYVNALLTSQQNVFGYNFIEDSLSNDVLRIIYEASGYSTAPDYIEDISGLIADYILSYKCTSIERTNTLKKVSDKFQTDIYTLSDTNSIKNINNRGVADTGWMMPRIFKCSKINLNITLRSIKTGIPQRVFDILGSGGFLISNYQPELLDLFEPNVDLVMYESTNDLIEKIDFYLNHESERLSIAKHGQETVEKHHTYNQKVNHILNVSMQ